MEEPARLPAHIAIIMDGNGRWAQARQLERIAGHEEGANSVRAISRACRRLGVKALTLYSFSTENWSRPSEEVDALMALLQRYLISERDEIMENGIRLNAIGQIGRLPSHVREPLRALCDATRDNRGMVLSLALSYGARADLLQAVQGLARDAVAGRLDPDAIDDALISRRLSTHDLPPLDLMIRTSGESRLSNFLLWEVAYAELVVTDVHWPEFREEQLRAALAVYAGRERRFGKTGAQVAAEQSSEG